MFCRAEQHAIMLISPTTQALIPHMYYERLIQALDCADTECGGDPILAELEKGGFLTWIRENADTVRSAMARSETVQPPENAYVSPTLLNLELTTRCPLRCPQCYCHLQGGKDIDLDRALEVLNQAAQIGTASINLSGGETMLYPHLYRLLEECTRLGLNSAVALSGYGLDKDSLHRLTECGVGEIYISLNGSTEDISRQTRDGHPLAVAALELLCESSFGHMAVNWVAHKSNIADFANVAALCERLCVEKLVVIALKPDSSHSMSTLPDHEQFLALAADIKRLRKESTALTIEVESCYSPLCAFLGQRFLTNLNTGITKGCGAGRDGACLNVDGKFTPCRHLDYAEDFDTLSEYWYNSKALAQLRAVEENPEAPCDKCRYSPYCLTCLAVNAKTQGKIVKADSNCMLWNNK